METQTLVVLAILSAAALYLGSRVYRAVRAARRRSSGGCGGGTGCGCSAEH